MGVPQTSHGTKDRCLDFNQQRPPLTEGGLPVVYGEIFAFFQACVGNFDTTPQWKVVGTLYLDSSYVTFKYFAFLSVCDKFELLGHIQFASPIISSRIASIDIGQQKLAKTDQQHKKISEFLTST